MSSSILLIGIDVGSSGVRVEVYSPDGLLIAVGREPIGKQNTDEWLRAIDAAIPSIVRECKDCEKYVSVDSTSGTYIPTDIHGDPLTNPVMYYEKQPDTYNRIKLLPSIDALAKKGVTVDAASPIVKLYHMKLYNPGLYNSTRWIVPAATWILYRLCIREGEVWSNIETDYTNALKFGLDISSDTPKWFTEVFQELGLDVDKMPRPTPCGRYICEAASRYAERMGLLKAKVFHGMTDGNASALAGGALKVGDINIYSGTTTVPKIVTDKFIVHQAIYYHIHPIKGYLAGAATGFTGAFLTWFAEKIFGISIDEAFRYMENVVPGTEFLFLPPGDRSPFYNPLMNAALLNLKIVDEPRVTLIGRFLRSVVLGITLMENSYIELFKDLFGVEANRIRVTGGGTRARLWNLMRASIYGKRVEVYGDLVALGTLIPIMIESKLYPNIERIEERFLKPIDVIEPDDHLVNTYKNLRNIFTDVWRDLQKLYQYLQ
uniref:Carbohydrate kinase n=1 Tax=Ignisphaera aggregans TaxID=334771 RepID=A0A7J3I946_9CREN